MLWLACRSLFFVNLHESSVGMTFTTPQPFLRRLCAYVPAKTPLCEFIALFFCSFSHIYNENAMLFSALYVVISFLQRLSCNIHYFSFFVKNVRNRQVLYVFLGAFDDRFVDRVMNAFRTIFRTSISSSSLRITLRSLRTSISERLITNL